MLKFLFNKCLAFLFFACLYSCNNKPSKVTILVSESHLQNLDSIRTQTPHNILDKGWNQAYSNLPKELRDERNNRFKRYQAWDEIVEKYKIESVVNIDTVSKLQTRVNRHLYKWIYKENKRVEEKVSVKDFIELLKDEGVQANDYKILLQKEVEWTGGSKSIFLELSYKGTINLVRLKEKGSIDITTFLSSQIPYWESQGYFFSTTTNETWEKYKNERGK